MFEMTNILNKLCHLYLFHSDKQLLKFIFALLKTFFVCVAISTVTHSFTLVGHDESEAFIFLKDELNSKTRTHNLPSPFLMQYVKPFISYRFFFLFLVKIKQSLICLPCLCTFILIQPNSHYLTIFLFLFPPPLLSLFLSIFSFSLAFYLFIPSSLFLSSFLLTPTSLKSSINRPNYLQSLCLSNKMLFLLLICTSNHALRQMRLRLVNFPLSLIVCCLQC